MGLHARAWSGLGIGIFGATPLLPMRLEQAVAEASPANELRVEAFEDYAAMFDFCKQARDVGFFILLENTGQLPFEQVFRELAKQYEVRGLPCFCALVHEGSESFRGLRALRDNRRIIDYVDAAALLARPAEVLEHLWTGFMSSFEAELIPKPLQDSFLSVAAEARSEGSLVFQDRVSQLLTATLNVSWMESVALRWYPVVSTLQQIQPAVVNPHTAFISIVQTAAPDPSVERLNVRAIIDAKMSLGQRIAGVTEALDHYRQTGELERVLNELATSSKPGAKALLRHLAKLKDRILTIAETSSKNSDVHAKAI